jgi:hypothetical protein
LDSVPPFRRWTLAARLAIAAVVALAVVPVALVYGIMLHMPGRSFSGSPPALSPAETAVRERLRADVSALAADTGVRNVHHAAALAGASDFVERELRLAGYEPQRQTYDVGGEPCSNVEAERRGSSAPDEIVLVGAHYDSARGTPGADDNASGVAAVLAVARELSNKTLRRTVRFVGFVNEEMPFFWTSQMGSMVYAKRSAERRERIVAMICLESIGFYSDAPGTQKYPFPMDLFYADRGDFIAFIGNVGSRSLVRSSVGAFRETASVRSLGAVLPEKTLGVGFSDHKSFWDAGYPALMVTDTAFMRNPSYHTPRDTIDTLDLDRMTRAVVGIAHVVERLADGAGDG